LKDRGIKEHISLKIKEYFLKDRGQSCDFVLLGYQKHNFLEVGMRCN